MIYKFLALAATLGVLTPVMSSAHVLKATGQVEALADLNTLNVLGIPVLARAQGAGVGYAVLTPEMQEKISAFNHSRGRCAGFEVLPPSPTANLEGQFRELQYLDAHAMRDRQWASFSPRRLAVPARPEITAALEELKEQNLIDFVQWASAFPSRYNAGSDPDIAVRPLVAKIQSMIGQARRFAPVNATVELVNHNSTKQHSVRVRIPGKSRPNEIVVIGGHFDSINQGWGDKRAPGADDNASGSANVMEAFRVILAHGPLERTVEFYWYAGEESGLLGSAEIAKAYKAANAQVIGVLQLDMTSFPGNGEFVIGNETDFTSAWLRDFLVGINDAYLHVKLVDDRCGYGCSDHASWYRQGFPTLMPFEATLNTMNGRIHTANDVIFDKTSWKHSHVYSKIALIFAMELGNSTARQPYN